MRNCACYSYLIIGMCLVFLGLAMQTTVTPGFEDYSEDEDDSSELNLTSSNVEQKGLIRLGRNIFQTLFNSRGKKFSNISKVVGCKDCLDPMSYYVVIFNNNSFAFGHQKKSGKKKKRPPCTKTSLQEQLATVALNQGVTPCSSSIGEGAKTPQNNSTMFIHEPQISPSTLNPKFTRAHSAITKFKTTTHAAITTDENLNGSNQGGPQIGAPSLDHHLGPTNEEITTTSVKGVTNVTKKLDGRSKSILGESNPSKSPTKKSKKKPLAFIRKTSNIPDRKNPLTNNTPDKSICKANKIPAFSSSSLPLKRTRVTLPSSGRPTTSTKMSLVKSSSVHPSNNVCTRPGNQSSKSIRFHFGLVKPTSPEKTKFTVSKPSHSTTPKQYTVPLLPTNPSDQKFTTSPSHLKTPLHALEFEIEGSEQYQYTAPISPNLSPDQRLTTSKELFQSSASHSPQTFYPKLSSIAPSAYIYESVQNKTSSETEVKINLDNGEVLLGVLKEAKVLNSSKIDTYEDNSVAPTSLYKAQGLSTTFWDVKTNSWQASMLYPIQLQLRTKSAQYQGGRSLEASTKNPNDHLNETLQTESHQNALQSTLIGPIDKPINEYSRLFGPFESSNGNDFLNEIKVDEKENQAPMFNSSFDMITNRSLLYSPEVTNPFYLNTPQELVTAQSLYQTEQPTINSNQADFRENPRIAREATSGEPIITDKSVKYPKLQGLLSDIKELMSQFDEVMSLTKQEMAVSETGKADSDADDEWKEWSAWSPCSVSCGKGQKVRKRVSAKPGCYDVDVQIQQCQLADCPLNVVHAITKFLGLKNEEPNIKAKDVSKGSLLKTLVN